MRKLKNYIVKQCENSQIRSVVLVLTKLLGFKSYQDRLRKMNAEEKFLGRKAAARKVLRGPFKGLQYPNTRYVNSDLAPKILGSYESELYPAIEEMCTRKYSDIIDVGSAEGYYAVGLAMRLPGAKVHAFDIEEDAIAMCKEMARLNNVYSQFTFNSFCSSETLANFPFKGRGLVICDCEGYEYDLFNEKCLSNLKNCDLLIELHDLYNPKISPHIKSLFASTHQITIIGGQNKSKAQFPELADFNELEQAYILSESRGGVLAFQKMEWAYLVAKTK